MLQNSRPNRKNGFTLIEIMIVIAVIAILAAIASLQFLNYNRRSYNAAAKSIVHILRADEGNIKAELGAYGWTEGVALRLTENISIPPASSDSYTVKMLRIPATHDHKGARLAGQHLGKQYAIGISLGDNMTADARGGEHFTICARHYKGDTAYGFDSDVASLLFSVSNPSWPNTPGIRATLPVSNSGADDLSNAEGGGLPTTQWKPTH